MIFLSAVRFTVHIHTARKTNPTLVMLCLAADEEFKFLYWDIPDTRSRTSANVVEMGRWRVRYLWPAPYMGCWIMWLVALMRPLYNWKDGRTKQFCITFYKNSRHFFHIHFSSAQGACTDINGNGGGKATVRETRKWYTLAIFTQWRHINAAAAIWQFSALFVHRAKWHWH